MGSRAFLVASAWAAMVVTAWADDPAALQRRGEQLAKDGQFGEAIDAFKAADAIEPTAERACLVALAYSRRNLYGQAELFFDLCHRRETSSDRIPDWVSAVERRFRARLDAANLARVTIVVTDGRDARVVVSAFTPDEGFSPRTIYLPRGRHTITVTAPQHAPVERVVTVDDHEPLRIEISLRDDAVAPPARTASHLGRDLILGGLGVAAVGGVIHATWYRSELNELEAAQSPADPARYAAHADAYRASRYVTVGLYSVGAATLVAGILLHAIRRHDTTPTIALTPASGGGVLSVAWSR